MQMICFNGQFFPAWQPVIKAGNSSFKWGDGLFETIRINRGSIQLSDFHFDRLEKSCRLLQIRMPEDLLSQKILELCINNQCLDSARVRLSVFRDENSQGSYLIETSSLDHSYSQFNREGLRIDIYPFARKTSDQFSNLKSANFLPYVMAAIYAEEKSMDDVILLNSSGLVCDSSKANIFLVKNNEIFTPSLDQGCINGVMRRYLIEQLHKKNIALHQCPVEVETLLHADEIFLTNALQGIKWVGSFRDRNYQQSFAHSISTQLFS